MATKIQAIKENYELKQALQDARTDIAALRASMAALLAKMDADFANVSNASTDYAATVTLPTLQLQA
jgi:hypothetical protein